MARSGPLANPTDGRDRADGTVLDRTRSNIIDGTLVGLSIIVVPAVLASLARLLDTGWIPTMALHISLAVLVLALTLMRRRLPYIVRAGFLVAAALVAGVAALLNVGIAGSGGAFFVAACIGAIMFFGPTTGAVVAGICVLSFVATFLITNGDPLVSAGIPPADYVRRAGTWISNAAGAILIAIGARAAIYIFGLRLLRIADEANRERGKLKALIDGAPDGILLLDQSERILEANGTAHRLFGYADSALVGQPMNVLVPGLTNNRARPAQSGFRRDGSIFPVAVRTSPVPGQDIVVAIVHDMTEQEATHEKLTRAEKLQAVGQLTSGVAHDFNNLLSVIVGNLDLMEGSFRDRPKDHERLKRVMDAADRGAALTRHLLAFARKQVLVPRTIDLGHEVRNVVAVLQRVLGPGIAVSIDETTGLWPCEVDPDQLGNALANLLINARDAMPKGGTVSVTCSNVTLSAGDIDDDDVRPGRFVRLSVKDRGSGMTPEVAARAIEPFFTTKDVGRGVGLGLSSVYGMVKQSGGLFRLKSTPGQGTEVEIHFPAVPDSVRRHRPSGSAKPSRVTAGLTLLLVEDDPSVREVTVAMLQAAGLTVIEAANAADGLAALDQNPDIGVLLTDVMLPGGDTGLDLAKEAKRRRPDLVIVVTSGYPGAPQLVASTLPEALPLLPKPFRNDQLLSHLDEAVRRQRTTQVPGSVSTGVSG